MSAPDFAGILGEHGALGYDDCDGCECGVDVRTHEQHRAHVAAVLNAAVAEWLQSDPVIEHLYYSVLALRDPERDDLREALSTLAATVEP